MRPVIDLTEDEHVDNEPEVSPVPEDDLSQPFFIDLTEESVESLMREVANLAGDRPTSATSSAGRSSIETASGSLNGSNSTLPFNNIHGIFPRPALEMPKFQPAQEPASVVMNERPSSSSTTAPVTQIMAPDARYSFSRMIARVIGNNILYGVVLCNFMRAGFFNPDMSIMSDGLYGVFLRRSGGHVNNTNVHVLDARTNQVIGFVDRTTSVALCRLLNDNIAFKQLQISAGIDLSFLPHNWRQLNNIHLCILVYGPHELRVGLRQIIANHGLALRQPEELDSIYGRGTFSPAAIYQNFNLASQKTITQDLARKQVEEIFASIKETDLLPEVEPSSYIRTELSPHQKMALFFMKSRENVHAHRYTEGNSAESAASKLQTLNNAFWKRRELNGYVRYQNILTEKIADSLPTEPKGGILADDMGLGKTLTTLSLIFSDFDRAVETGDKTLRKAHATLIICPLSLISSWKDEIRKHVDENEIKYRIYTHHGPQRTDSVDWLFRQDMVITTYHTLAADFKRKKAKKRKIVIDGSDDDIETDDEIEAAVGAASSLSVLHKVKWHRIVLDEAHFIKEHKTTMAKAVFELDSESKWCLTGTPLQNKLDDLFSLLKFLDVEPFSDLRWWSENISRSKSGHGMKTLQALMKIVTLRRTKDQLIKGKPIVDIPPRKDSVWYVELAENERPLYNIVYERSKELFREYDGTPDEAGVHTNALYGKIFETLLRLRQICAHSGLVRKADTIKKLVVAALTRDGHHIQGYRGDKVADEVDEVNYEEIYKVLKECGDDNCCACGKDFSISDNLEEEPVQAFMSSCLHLYCEACIRLHKSGPLPCASCGVLVRNSYSVGKKQKTKAPASSHDNDDLDIDLPEDNNPYEPLKHNEPSSKVKALIADLMRLKPQGIKSVVFSQWTQYLDILAIHCKNAGIKCVKFDGSMNMQVRANVLSQFKNFASGIDVLLISLKAGGVGLNLNEASRVYIMDPWWNPSVESQAIDRIHRMGQRKQVETIRIVAQDTIEERIIHLQEKKSELAKEALMDKRAAKEVKKMKAEDLRTLFSE